MIKSRLSQLHSLCWQYLQNLNLQAGHYMSYWGIASRARNYLHWGHSMIKCCLIMASSNLYWSKQFFKFYMSNIELQFAHCSPLNVTRLNIESPNEHDYLKQDQQILHAQNFYFNALLKLSKQVLHSNY